MSTVSLNEKDMALLKAVVDISWDKVLAEVPELKTTKYARDRWTVVRKKLLGEDGKTGKKAGGDDGTPAASAKKATPRKRKTAAEDEDDEEATPAPKKKRGAKAKSVAPGDEGEVHPLRGVKQRVGLTLAIDDEEPTPKPTKKKGAAVKAKDTPTAEDDDDEEEEEATTTVKQEVNDCEFDGPNEAGDLMDGLV